MALKELRLQVELEQNLNTIKEHSENESVKAISYFDLLDSGRYRSIGTIKIMDMIKDIDKGGYESLCYQLAVEAIKNPKIVEEPKKMVEVKDSKDKNDITFWLNEVQKKKGKG